MSTGWAKVSQSGEKDGAMVSPKGDIIHTCQKVKAKVTEANKARARDQVNATTVVSQAIGQESVLKPESFSSHVTIVVRRVTKRHNVNPQRDQEKERECMRSVEMVSGCGSQASQAKKSLKKSAKPPPPKESTR